MAASFAVVGAGIAVGTDRSAVINTITYVWPGNSTNDCSRGGVVVYGLLITLLVILVI